MNRTLIVGAVGQLLLLVFAILQILTQVLTPVPYYGAGYSPMMALSLGFSCSVILLVATASVLSSTRRLHAKLGMTAAGLMILSSILGVVLYVLGFAGITFTFVQVYIPGFAYDLIWNEPGIMLYILSNMIFGLGVMVFGFFMIFHRQFIDLRLLAGFLYIVSGSFYFSLLLTVSTPGILLIGSALGTMTYRFGEKEPSLEPKEQPIVKNSKEKTSLSTLDSLFLFTLAIITFLYTMLSSMIGAGGSLVPFLILATIGYPFYLGIVSIVDDSVTRRIVAWWYMLASFAIVSVFIGFGILLGNGGPVWILIYELYWRSYELLHPLTIIIPLEIPVSATYAASAVWFSLVVGLIFFGILYNAFLETARYRILNAFLRALPSRKREMNGMELKKETRRNIFYGGISFGTLILLLLMRVFTLPSIDPVSVGVSYFMGFFVSSVMYLLSDIELDNE